MASSPVRLTGAMTVAALMLCALAEPAAARVTFAGIDDVRFGMSRAQVTDVLGQPTSSEPGRNPTVTSLNYSRRKLEVLVHRDRDRVVQVATTSRAQRTSKGLGVGSSIKAVRTQLRGEKCGSAKGTAVCSIERSDRVMDFELRRGTVIRVAVTDLG